MYKNGMISTNSPQKKPRGVAAMDDETRARVQAAGGKACLEKHGKEHFAAMGRKGGTARHQRKGK